MTDEANPQGLVYIKKTTGLTGG